MALHQYCLVSPPFFYVQTSGGNQDYIQVIGYFYSDLDLPYSCEENTISPTPRLPVPFM